MGVQTPDTPLASSSYRVSETSSLDEKLYPITPNGTRVNFLTRFSLKWEGDNRSGLLQLTGVHEIESPRTRIGGSSPLFLYQRVRVSSVLHFDNVTGVPTGVTDTSVQGWNLVGSDNPYEWVGIGPPTSPLDPFATYQGKSYGNWASVQPLTWPMWEISGSQFRFFGQNWIRLIKVSGP